MAGFSLHIGDFVAEIAVHAVGIRPGDRIGIGSIGGIHGRARRVARGAVARCLREIELVARAIVGLRQIGTQGKTAIIAAVTVAGERTRIAVHVGPVVHRQKTRDWCWLRRARRYPARFASHPALQLAHEFSPSGGIQA